MPNNDVLDSGNDAMVDAMIIGVKNYDCETFDPKVFGLSADVAKDVIAVIRGKDCASLFIPPDAKCTTEITPAASALDFEGTLLLMKSGGYKLIDGKMVYKAVRDACGDLPGVEVSAMGISMQPTTEFELYSSLENSPTGTTLIRFHMWDGQGTLTSEDHGAIINVSDGIQVVLDPATFQVVDAKNYNPDETPPPKARTQAPSDGGCNTTLAPHPGLDGLTTVLLTAIALSGLRKGYRASLAAALKSTPK